MLRRIVFSLLWLAGTAGCCGTAEATITFSRGAVIALTNATSAGIQAIAVADLNHDGKADILSVQPADNAVNVYINDGTGAFGNPTAFPTAMNPVAVTTGDFNHDGNPDMAIVAQDGDVVTVYLGDGTGSFLLNGTSSPRDWPVDRAPLALVAADLNNDGFADLAILSDSSIHLLKSNGDGTFVAFSPPSISIGRGQSGAVAIAAGRLSSLRNFIDLAVSTASAVSVLLNNGDGTFGSPSFAATGLVNPQGLAIGEFDGDTHAPDTNPDIAVINGNDVSTTVIILQGNGAGQFTPYDTASVQASAECGSVAIVAVDLDGDGKQDLAVGSAGTVCGTTGQIQLYCQQTSADCVDTNPHAPPDAGGFQLQLPRGSLIGDVSALQSGDINGDGMPDLVAVESADLKAIKILINAGPSVAPTNTPAPSTPTGTPTASPTSPPSPNRNTTDSGDSCAIAPAQQHHWWTWTILPAIWIAIRLARRTLLYVPQRT